MKSADGDVLLETKGLSRDFPLPRSGFAAKRTLRHALVNLDLVVRAGARLGIVGESGSGKTTLVRLLLALDSPTAGNVMFRGEHLPVRDMLEFRRSVQVVFQDPRSSLNPRMTVEDVIGEPLDCLAVEGDRARRVREVLDSVGLSGEMCRRFPHELSGGQRQRVAIARALAPRPKVLIADEPVSALDVLVRDEILALLANLTNNLGLTLVLISHDLSVIARLCDEVVVLQHGVAVERGMTTDVFSNPQHDFTRQLIAAVPHLPVLS
ncbi:MAG: ATP-binding cassette domain-containing protein [Ilumatobacteraceae bacterium]|jgi:ABC-type glutathione transport system ATPase component